SAQIREILISESAWEEMTCLFAPSLSGSVGRRPRRAAPRVCLERIDIDNKFRQAIYFSINSRI
ncbi:hypothetical protein AAGL05_25055, partial [Klebsiella pneumoniae]